jgi:ribonuclease HI
MDSDLKDVVIYTDGACLVNPGRGGYGVVLRFGTHRKELSGGYRLTTNSRMELHAAIAGLSALKERCHVVLHSDAEYLVNPMNKEGARGWRKRGWRRSGHEPVLNPDL